MVACARARALRSRSTDLNTLPCVCRAPCAVCPCARTRKGIVRRVVAQRCAGPNRCERRAVAAHALARARRRHGTGERVVWQRASAVCWVTANGEVTAQHPQRATAAADRDGERCRVGVNHKGVAAWMRCAGVARGHDVDAPRLLLRLANACALVWLLCLVLLPPPRVTTPPRVAWQSTQQRLSDQLERAGPDGIELFDLTGAADCDAGSARPCSRRRRRRCRGGSASNSDGGGRRRRARG